MIKGLFYGTNRKKPTVDNPQALIDFIKRRFKDGQRFQILITEEEKDKTTAMYGYLYACIYAPISHQEGWPTGDVDNYFKRKFLSETQGFNVPPQINLSKSLHFDGKLLSEFIDCCCQWSAEDFGICVPPPDTNWKFKNLKGA